MIFKLRSRIDKHAAGIIDKSPLLGGNYLANIFRGFGVHSSVSSIGANTELVTEIISSMRNFYFFLVVFVIIWISAFGRSILPNFVQANGVGWIAPIIMLMSLPTLLVHLQHRMLLKQLAAKDLKSTEND